MPDPIDGVSMLRQGAIPAQGQLLRGRPAAESDHEAHEIITACLQAARGACFFSSSRARVALSLTNCACTPSVFHPHSSHPSLPPILCDRAQFLDAKDAPSTVNLPLPRLLESSPAPRPHKAVHGRIPSATPDTVWVDCFYYGFYMDKARLPAFQASLRQRAAGA